MGDDRVYINRARALAAAAGILGALGAGMDAAVHAGGSPAQRTFVARVLRVLELAGEVREDTYLGPAVDSLPALPAPLVTLLAHLRAGRPPGAEETVPARRWLSVAPSAERALVVSRRVVDFLSERQAQQRRFLDLGAGPGLVAADVLSALTQVQATLVDMSAVLEQSERYLRLFAARVRFQALDLAKSNHELPLAAFDLALLSNVLHTLAPTACQRVITQARRALVGGGVIVVAGLCNSSVTGAFFGMSSALMQEENEAYPREQIADWLRVVGFTDIASESVEGDMALLHGRAPVGVPGLASMYAD